MYASPRRSSVETEDPGVAVRRLPGRFGPRSLLALENFLVNRPQPDRILVQYVPHAFGFKAMNLPFALWTAFRLRRVAPVWVMFHEISFPLMRRPLSHALIGATTRIMARSIASTADRIFVSVPAWASFLKRICPRSKPAEWLPVPCNVATEADSSSVAAVREQFAPGGKYLVGHFGTFGDLVADLLAPAFLELLRLVPNSSILLVGRRSDAFRDRLASTNVEFAKRIYATGDSAAAISAHLRACDVVVQPYPDGISSRRGTAMAALANGVPIVTNLGELSEPLWSDGSVALAATPDPKALSNLAAGLLVDSKTRAQLSQRSLALYRDSFALEKTVARLRETSR